jgi:predicted helicase
MTTTKQITSIHDLLEEYRSKISNSRDLGTSFERLVKSYLENDPINTDQYTKVSMWSDWEHKWGPDCGIDLVAEDRNGDFVAIQCKFYAPEYDIKKEDINSFLAESSKTFKLKGKQRSFTQRIIFSTSDCWSSNAENSLVDQSPPVIRIHIRELEQSTIDWSNFSLEKPGKVTFKEKKKPRAHQEEAILKVLEGFKKSERGKLIMACGTGKTFTSLKLAERFVKKDGVVLFLVPSISLLSQTLREWTAESEKPFHAFAVCSDSKIGKDNEDISKHELLIPATTDTKSLIKGLESAKGDNRWIVIFSTYQSIDVVSQAQKKGLPEFDLVICDEAHRTTGVTLADQDESHFVKVHDQKFIKATKRLYMTATPKVFGNAVKTKADNAGAELCSMDDVSKFGPEFHRLGFGKAVSEGLLTDYKVLILAVDQRIISENFQKKFANEDKELELDDVARIIGCWNGLSKRFIGDEAAVEDGKAMKRAVAFVRSIKDSKKIANAFQGVVKEYISKNKLSDAPLDIEAHHVDGSFNVLKRNAELDWLKAEAPENTCRILSNARCLSEGVDVPALDAVLFLNSRDSQIDVVQSVGRIMRKFEGKTYGYIILPIGIPAGIAPEVALKDNKKYKVVWDILQALRAHDDRFDASINQMDLNKKKPSNVSVIGVGPGGELGDGNNGDSNQQLSFNFPEIEEWRDAIYAKIVLKCGSRPYWENWASDVAKIAEKHTEQIKKLLKSNEPKTKKEFSLFLEGMRKNINPSISESDAIEMLSQHLITKPVFDALFEHYPFTDKNPVSRSMQKVLNVLNSNFAIEDTEKLKSFYDSVKLRVKGIDNPEGRQKIIVELYDRFFKVAFPKMSDRLGIVYTPIEVVDFIINSVETVLKEEFNQSLSNKGVHVLDPFTGTGTFIVRLLQSGIIKQEDLKRKLSSELHANEIVLLAYYIATINIEETFHGITGGEYSPFEGIVLTDTFQLGEDDSQTSFKSIMPENSERVEKQKSTKVNVIISNPPYSIGQDSANDDSANAEYSVLDQKISNTYIAMSSSKGGKRSTYDSYIRAFRWASDRLDNNGIIGFVTNAGFLTSNSADGLRKSLSKEFSKIYCFNLRGNQRTSGELSRKEGGKIFGSGSRTPVAITILIKKSNHTGPAEIFYHDIGDYLSREEKLLKVKKFSSIKEIDLQLLKPNISGDWLNKRNDNFSNFISMGTKGASNDLTFFEVYSNGVVSNRDNWVYSFSKKDLVKKCVSMIDFYNSEIRRYKKYMESGGKQVDIPLFVEKDVKKISWGGGNWPAKFRRFEIEKFDDGLIQQALYRPFNKQWHYGGKTFNHSFYSMLKIFPKPSTKNIAIMIKGNWKADGNIALMVNSLTCLQPDGGAQCFPLFYYDELKDVGKAKLPINLSNSESDEFEKHDSISDSILNKIIKIYSDTKISKEDVFYYIYGILHSTEYLDQFQNDLNKLIPRIPFCKDFWGFSKSGRELAHLHLNYESLKPFEIIEEVKENHPKSLKELFRLNEVGMKFSKINKKEDRTTIIYNENVILKEIPLETYDYRVNGKSALDWIIERYKVTIDKESGIKNDCNEWSDNPRYIVDLIARIVRVCIETNKIVKALPALDILSE